MKTCPACRLHVEDDYLYCWDDGTPLNAEPAQTVSNPSRPPDASPQSEDATRPSLLYCPACAGEYPLTFVECPLDHLPLSSKRIGPGRVTAKLRTTTITEAVAIPDADLTPLARAEEDSEPEARYNPDPATIHSAAESRPALGQRWSNLRDRASSLWRQLDFAMPYASRRLESLDWGLGSVRSAETEQASRSMQLTAKATAIALVLLTLAALYIIYNQFTRKPARSSVRVAVQKNIAPMESPLIATPQEAREYQEESDPLAATSAHSANSADKETPSPASQNVTQQPRSASPGAPPKTSTAAPIPSARASLPAASLDSGPLTGGGRFNTQLVRVRSYRSTSGYRYDLTFMLREQAGRPMRWDRLSIVTRSANGVAHTESLPFQYWLAAAGALTFTVNVEMSGASEADWRGRISCTSVGSDEMGRPLRASFGANVAP